MQLAPITRIIYFYSGPVMSQVPRLDLVLTAHDQAYTHNSSVQNCFKIPFLKPFFRVKIAGTEGGHPIYIGLGKYYIVSI